MDPMDRAFFDELSKLAQGAPAPSKGMAAKIWEWMKKNPGKSGFAGGWLAHTLLSGGNKE
jgi:hypothetical protein